MSFNDEINAITNNNFILEVFIALTIVVGSLILGKILGRIVDKFLKKTSINKVVYDATKVRVNLDKIISTLVSYAIYLFGFIWALNYLGIASTVLNLLSGAILILALILAFLAFKDFIPNMMSGLFIHAKGFLKEGDVIKLHDIEGKIIYLNLVETRVKTKNGDIIYIPNSRLTKYEVIKKSHKKKSK